MATIIYKAFNSSLLSLRLFSVDITHDTQFATVLCCLWLTSYFQGQMIKLCKFPSELNITVIVNRTTAVHAQLEMEYMILKLTKQSCTPLIYTNKAFLIDTAQVFVSQEGFMQ